MTSQQSSMADRPHSENHIEQHVEVDEVLPKYYHRSCFFLF